jgi:hypothetical protein
MDKEDCQRYISRWESVKEIEAKEAKNAPFNLLLLQTFSIWDIGRSLHFFTPNQQPTHLWGILQRRWEEKHAGPNSIQ